MASPNVAGAMGGGGNSAKNAYVRYNAKLACFLTWSNRLILHRSVHRHFLRYSPPPPPIAPAVFGEAIGTRLQANFAP